MARTKECPKCDADISDSYQEDDWSVGAVGGYYCDACDLAIGLDDYEPLEGDVGIPPMPRDKPLGTPLSELSGRAVPPDHPDYPKYQEFLRIAKSWGFP